MAKKKVRRVKPAAAKKIAAKRPAKKADGGDGATLPPTTKPRGWR